MSLYGALFSGVSGLAAQSSAMGAISDNISNVNTTGYKGAKVNFSTLVTKQVSLTNYSPGGVQSRPRASVDVQGLLQATNSSTDVAISGQGFFVVNEAAHPGDGDMFAYTRAGSFKVDTNGYLQNVSGWYMQGWPLTTALPNSNQATTVTVGNTTYVKGYKDATGNPVYINDNIVNSTYLQPLNLNEIGGTASQTRQLRMGANLPNGDVVGKIHNQPVTIYDSLGGDATVSLNWTKRAQNQWDLEGVPPLGTKSMILRNQTASGGVGAAYSAMGRLDFLGVPTTASTSNMTMTINNTPYTFSTRSGVDGSTANQFFSDPSGLSTGTFVGNLASDINKAFNIEYNSLNINCSAGVASGTTLSLYLNGSTTPTPYTFTGATTDAQTTADTLNTMFASAANGLKAVRNGNNVSIYSENAMTFSVDTGGSGAPFATAANWSNGSGATGVTSMTTTGVTYCEQLAGTNSLIFRQTDPSNPITVAGLDNLDLTSGTPATMQNQDLSSPNTFTIEAVAAKSTPAVTFNGDGTPKAFNVSYMDIDWANGSTDMSGTDTINLFLGNTGVFDGMTQLDGDYQLAYWNQDGAKFGNFAGVSIGTDGIVTALFDNGVTRPVFQIPVATFVNPNGMESLTGNVFISTDNSGEPTLREAGSAGAGQVNAASLEASTVDIGEEFTTMIVTQRAYSAAAKIITTADQMLDELVQIKR